MDAGQEWPCPRCTVHEEGHQNEGPVLQSSDIVRLSVRRSVRLSVSLSVAYVLRPQALRRRTCVTEQPTLTPCNSSRIFSLSPVLAGPAGAKFPDMQSRPVCHCKSYEGTGCVLPHSGHLAGDSSGFWSLAPVENDFVCFEYDSKVRSVNGNSSKSLALGPIQQLLAHHLGSSLPFYNYVNIVAGVWRAWSRCRSVPSRTMYRAHSVRPYNHTP